MEMDSQYLDSHCIYSIYAIDEIRIAIVECKSRIDKGLVTDILDEFDHVLGRGMDTYSDEMDEIQANQMIEAAIDQYYYNERKIKDDENN